MSPTIPPVLVLSLLLVSPLPLAEAGRSTDLFALIRGTLKYWRKIYKIYEEEVVLGYCWADYFLHREEPSTDSPMPPPSMILDPTSFLGVDIFEGGKKKDSDPAHIFVDRGWRFARDKRSYETANFTENTGALFANAQRKGYRWSDAGKKSGDSNLHSTSTERINLGKNGETVVDSLARFIWLDNEQERNRAKRSYDTTREGVLGILGRVVGNGVKETGDSHGNSKSINGSRATLRVKNVEFLQNNSSMSGWVNGNGRKTGNNIEMREDNANYFWGRFTNSNGKSLKEITADSYLESNDYDFFSETRYSKSLLNAILQSTKTMMEKVFENLEETLRTTSNTRLDPRGERASKVSKVSEKATTENRGEISFAEPNSSSKRADRIQKTTFSVDPLNASESADRQRSNATRNFPTHLGDQRIEDKKAVPDSKTLKARVPSKIQTDRQRCRQPSTDRDVKDPSSPPFPQFSSHKLNPAVHRENPDEPGIPIEGKSERSETGWPQKSTSPRPATRGKLLRSRSCAGTSGTSQTRGTTPSSGARFEDTRPGEGTGDNREPGDPSRGKSYGSSNLGFPGVAERHSFRGNYRRNLRRKRDANDRIRSRRGRLLGSSYNSTSVDEIPRCSTSHVPAVYGTPATQIRSPSTTDPGRHRSATKNEIGPYYLEARQKTASLNCETRTAIAANSIRKKSVYPRKFPIERWWWRRQWPGQRAKATAKVEEETRKGDGKGSSSKQLARTKDNRYRTRNSLHVENSAARRAGKKRTAVPYPMGRSSLLSVSQPRFMGDYENSTSITARNSRIGRSSRVEDQGRRSSVTRAGARGVGRDFATVFHLRQAFMGFLRALGIFVQVGRQLVDYVESNSALACTKDYLVGKAMQWIDS